MPTARTPWRDGPSVPPWLREVRSRAVPGTMPLVLTGGLNLSNPFGTVFQPTALHLHCPARQGKRGPPTLRESMFHPNGPTFLELAVQALSSTERGYDLL